MKKLILLVACAIGALLVCGCDPKPVDPPKSAFSAGNSHPMTKEETNKMVQAQADYNAKHPPGPIEPGK